MPCCAWLQMKLDHMNQNGLTVVPRVKQGSRFFAVRFRSVDPRQWQELSGALPKGTPFATTAEMALVCCPGCGTRLDSWIASNADVFDKLVHDVVD